MQSISLIPYSSVHWGVKSWSHGLVPMVWKVIETFFFLVEIYVFEKYVVVNNIEPWLEGPFLFLLILSSQQLECINVLDFVKPHYVSM